MELRGATDVRRLLTGYLASAYPACLATVRELFDLTTDYLPDPAEYIDHPPFAVDKFPSLSVNATRMTGMRAQPPDGAVYEWEVPYSCEVVAWVSATWENVWNLRDDMTGAIRRLFLTTPAFAFNAEDDDPINARVEAVGMAEEYGDPVKQTGDLYGLGGLVAFTLVVPESITRPPIGAVVQTAVTVHPALAE